MSKASKKKNSRATDAIKVIAKLYAIEKSLSDVATHTRSQRRKEQAKPVIDKLKTWLDETRPNVAPKTTLGKVLH